MKQIAQENIIELVELGHERAAELKASCGAVDVRSLAQLISDLATQLEVQLVRGNALAAENVTLNDKMNKLATWPGIEFYSSAWVFYNLDGNDALEFMCDVQTPATDAFLAEVRAQGVESGVNTVIAMMNHQHPATSQAIDILKTHAAQLRKGAAQ